LRECGKARAPAQLLERAGDALYTQEKKGCCSLKAAWKREIAQAPGKSLVRTVEENIKVC
jgi:hypothetical protein